ncbi:YceI family protein [Ulvibacter litoralis]|uniref:Polyisoprenoid-binding protein YceI n=1 Tax=Ulvibacter litoralis TaxID=227084 RepID=A0A1G7GRK2_9FLAO|nr:YceI family protein [Ulvibacter litoralis]GHC55349.1 lipid-binding protein [Ulvibacter litoralis]SDE90673.1 Polyisoprenoid-binding protein YceI [Ulvibacter litoralis]
MKKSILNIALVAFVTLGAVSCKDAKKEDASTPIEEAAEATDMATKYTVDTATSKISWKGEKPTGSHNGFIKISSGELAVADKNVQAGNFVIDMNSIVSEDLDGDMKNNLEAHLKGTVEGKEGDFFNVGEYPNATFELTGIEGENGTVTVKGNLTIKDKTNAIEFPATVSFPGDTMLLKSETFTIDRTKWGVNYGSKSIFGDLGDKFINDDIELTVELHATK